MTLEEQLLELGFTKEVMCYSISISRDPKHYKVISVSPQLHNQYVYIREADGDEDIRLYDEVVTIFNSDYDGELKIEWIEKLVNLLK